MIKIDCDDSGPFVVARVSGTLDADTTKEFATSLEQYIPQSGGALIIDMSQLESIDSSGLGKIIKLVTHARLLQG